jgi:hypothetical protein
VAVETVAEREADLCRRVAAYLEARDRAQTVAAVRLVDDVLGSALALRSLLLDEAAALGASWADIGAAFGTDATSTSGRVGRTRPLYGDAA